MSLRASKILFVFLEVSNIKRHRALLEEGLGFRVVENRFHPPHNRHGIVKYDAGDTVLALNLASPASFDPGGHEGIVQVYEVDSVSATRELLLRDGRMRSVGSSECLSDEDSHLYAFVPRLGGHALGPPWLVELRLDVGEMPRSLVFYRDCLGLEVVERTSLGVVMATRNVRLSLRCLQESGVPPLRRQDGCLVVFHCASVLQSWKLLLEQGVRFSSEPQVSEIGWSVQFKDPSGHRFCLYEPSQEALSWESGDKVREILGRQTI